MKITQIAPLVNDVLKATLGETTELLTEDLSNVVSVGETIENASAYDNYVNALVDRIGRVVFVDRKYSGKMLNVLRDNWDYGSILEKIDGDLPSVVNNEDWQLTDATSYDPNIFNAPNGVRATFFNGLTTFEIDRSITDMQVRQSFVSPQELNRFIDMIFTKIENALTLATENLIKRTLNDAMSMVVNNAFNGDYNSIGNAQAVNLLALYKQVNPDTTLTANTCLQNPDFIRFATFEMTKRIDMLTEYSTLFNLNGRERFTPRDLMHVVLLSDFKRSSDVYLQSDTFHNELTELPNSEIVMKWQTTGANYAFEDVSSIKVKNSLGDDVECKGIIGVLFDRDCLGVSLFDRRVRTNYNAKAEFTNYFYKQDARYFNDCANENMVVFIVAD